MYEKSTYLVSLRKYADASGPVELLLDHGCIELHLILDNFIVKIETIDRGLHKTLCRIIKRIPTSQKTTSRRTLCLQNTNYD